MKAPLRCLAVLLGLGLLSACSSHPAGVSRSEWQRMSPRQQARVHHQESQAARDDFRDLAAFSQSLGDLRE